MRQLILTGIVLLGICGSGHASELGDEYAAYQEAAALGDARGALPHARQAYELGLAEYGPDSRNTGLLAFNYGSALNAVLDFTEAEAVLSRGMGALVSSPDTQPQEIFDLCVELARASLARDHTSAAQDVIRRMRDYIPETFDPNSDQAAEVSYLTGLLFAFELPLRSADEYISVGRYVFASRTIEPVRDRADAVTYASEEIERALSIWQQEPGNEIKIARAQLVHAAIVFRGANPRQADPMFQQAIQTLIDLSYSDYVTTRLASEWIANPQYAEWRQAEIMDNVNLVAALASFRAEGDIIPLYRAPPRYPGGLVLSGIEGPVCLMFTVTDEGRVENIEVTSTDSSPGLERASRRALEQFLYAPQMIDGTAVDREGVRFCINYDIRR